jgi:hypothetical protein
LDVRAQSLDRLATEESLGVAVLEGVDHAER